jgi:predicted ATPase
LEALIRQLEGLACQQPVFMVFEDAHWIDPTSRELLDLTVERVGSLPVLGAALRSHHYRKKDSADSSLPPSGHAAVERAEHKMLHTVRV